MLRPREVRFRQIWSAKRIALPPLIGRVKLDTFTSCVVTQAELVPRVAGVTRRVPSQMVFKVVVPVARARRCTD